jgi:hypothetical protein
MPQYIEFNGETIEFPDNMSDTQIAAALKGQAAPAPAAAIPGQAAKAPPAQQEAPSTLEQMFGAGSPIARTLKGDIVDTALAVNSPPAPPPPPSRPGAEPPAPPPATSK